jgi:divalent metal cation (Fe/Co/Zn/Cd) transporter
MTASAAAAAATGVRPTTAQLGQEHAIVFAIAIDAGVIFLILLAGIVGGSLTMMAELFRCVLGYALECFTLVVIRRIHRGKLAEMEYGAGKVEQVASALIAISMLLAGVWLGLNVWHIWTGERALGSPLGLAYAAIVGFLNIYINVLAWDGMRRSMTADSSLIMDAQLQLRWVKLVASAFVGVALTVSAVSTDDVIVAWGESAGSLFVAGYMVVNAIDVLRTALPDLLDRSAGPAVRAIVTRALETHAGDYEQMLRMRTRRSGRATFVELHLAYDPMLCLAEVERRIEALEATVRGGLRNADIAVIATAAPRTA